MLEQKLYTVADVAELTGLTSRTIRNYLKDGTLRGKKIGVQWRFTEEDINRLFFEVDTKGERILKPEDIISDFMNSEGRQNTECCFAWDIPFGEDEEEVILNEAKKMMSAKRDMAFAWEIRKEQRVLRIAALGTLDKMEELAVRMREFEQRRTIGK